MEHNVTRIFNLFADVGVIYKRLLNHRPVIQNEVHHFVKEFEGQRGDNDLHSLQSSMSMASEMDVVFLEEIMTTSPHFQRIRKQAEEISELCSEIISKERNDLVGRSGIVSFPDQCVCCSQCNTIPWV